MLRAALSTAGDMTRFDQVVTRYMNGEPVKCKQSEAETETATHQQHDEGGTGTRTTVLRRVAVRVRVRVLVRVLGLGLVLVLVLFVSLLFLVPCLHVSMLPAPMRPCACCLVSIIGGSNSVPFTTVHGHKRIFGHRRMDG